MSKLNGLIAQLCPDGVTNKRLEELFDLFSGMTGVSAKWSDEGNCEFIDYMNAYTNLKIDVSALKLATVKSTKQNELKKGDVLFTGASETPDECAIASEIEDEIKSGVFMDDHLFGLRLKKECCNFFVTGFLKYVFRAVSFRNQLKKVVRGATRFYVSKTDFLKLSIPVPPLPVQEEIVRILDSFTVLTAELTTELTTELAARKQQYEYYRDHLLTFSNDVPQVELGDYFPHIRNGFVGTATPYFTTEEDGIRYLKGTNIHNGVISDNDYCYITPAFHQKHIRNELKADDILVVQSGHVGECAVVGEKYAGANCHALIIMSNGGQCSSKFVVHYLHSAEGKRKIAAITTGGTVKHILASEMKKFKIPFPPIAEQERIVALLDRFDFLCHDITLGLPAEIEARKKQYEYYRDKLLTFKELDEDAG